MEYTFAGVSATKTHTNKQTKFTTNITRFFTRATYGVVRHRGAVPKNFRDNMSSYDLAVAPLLETATDKECFLEVKKIMVKRSQSIVQNISPLSAIS